ncbi:undecaprenyl-diphosphate phosphatase [Polyangium aurulentum]|uniref:undecaprenyl-diphosphate phosphatase n=1 Tax=Polyangium aurulentum TaxID=2567896 RepID=UPI001F1D4B64|nr:undecaprenyl-diphosphate phosphatase [Polyangium aurulentum]
MLPLYEVTLLAGIQGLAEALPVSRSGHDAVAWLWLEPGRRAATLEGLLHLGTASALLVAARQRLLAALGEGLRAIARPALLRTSPPAHDAATLVIAACASLVVRVVLRPFVELWSPAPIALGVGLVITGFALASTRFAPRPHTDAPSLPLAGLLGLGHGLGALPGASDVGAALVLLAWMGVRASRALDLALGLSALTLLAAFGEAAAAAWRGGTGLATGAVTLGLVTAFLGATIAAGLLRALLARKSLPLLALWVVPLGFATLAYARVLPVF